MKKLLLGTATALTLTGAAQAGPALDALIALLPPDASVRFTSERVDAGLEVYEGLEIATSGNRTRFDQAGLALSGALFTLDGSGVTSSDLTGATAELGALSLSAPIGLFEAGSPETLSPDLCARLQDPVRLEASELRIPDAGRIGSFRVSATVAPVEGACALDFEQALVGFEFVPQIGPGLRVDQQSLSGRAPVAMGLIEVPTGELFSSELVIRNAEMTLNGTPQIRVGEARSRSTFDADSGLPLVEAGYNRHLEALTSGLAEGRAPEEQLPYADLWNAGRALNTDGALRISGVEVVGPDVAPLSPLPGLLDLGARLELEMSVTKAAELLELAVKLDGSNTLLLDLVGAVRIEEADPSFNALSPRALLMSAPVSFLSGSVRLSDRGVGAAGAQLLGADPYLMIAPSLAGLIGERNAQILSGWLATAKDGGEARISADPAQPVPVLMLGMMGLGDWSALGTMLNVSR